MSNVDSRIPKLLVSTGAAMTMLGIFLPWQCYRGILDLCLTGLYMNWSALGSSSTTHLVLMAFTPAALYHMLSTHWQFREVWKFGGLL